MEARADVPSRAAWDEGAATYPEIEKITGRFVPPLLAVLPPPAGRTFADVGAGLGAVSAELAAAGASVVAVDLSEAMLAGLRRRLTGRGLAGPVSTVVADAEHLPLPDGSVTGVISNFGVIFCADVVGGLGELGRAAGPEGTVAFTAWTTPRRNGWPSLLDGHEADLGFTVPAPPQYRWRDIDHLRSDCERAGLADIEIDTRPGPPTIIASWASMGDRFGSAASKAMLAAVTEPQRERLVEVLMASAREQFGEATVELPCEAWIVRATGRPPVRRRAAGGGQ